jgi:hypothetical protein
LSQSLNELNLSIVIERKKLIEAINIIHDDLYDEFEV